MNSCFTDPFANGFNITGVSSGHAINSRSYTHPCSPIP
ncbi:hypothetical protein EC836_101560 [Erwinia sp. JUb26]|nr:hypothetical protein EC836_101560 [Erwinia sp. JUb26]